MQLPQHAIIGWFCERWEQARCAVGLRPSAGRACLCAKLAYNVTNV